MVSGPFDNFEVRGPLADDNLWVHVAMETAGPQTVEKTIEDIHLQQLEEKATQLRIYEGEGQAFATKGGGPGRADVFYRTFYLEQTGADAEQVVRQSNRLDDTIPGITLNVKKINVLCETPSPTQDVLPSQIDPVFRSADE